MTQNVPAPFKLDEVVYYSDRPMRVAGVAVLEGANGQKTTRYLLEDAAGSPVLLEEGDGRFALLRPFPPGAQPPGKIQSKAQYEEARQTARRAAGNPVEDQD